MLRILHTILDMFVGSTKQEQRPGRVGPFQRASALATGTTVVRFDRVIAARNRSRCTRALGTAVVVAVVVVVEMRNS